MDRGWKNLMKILHGIEYALVRLAVWGFQHLSRPVAVRCGGWLGRFIRRLWNSRRRVVADNLTIAFGNRLSATEKKRLSREIFTNIGKAMAEIAHFPLMGRDGIMALATSEGEAAFQEAVDYGRGAILAGSHFGNWELAGAYVRALGFPVDFLVRGQHNRQVDDLMTRLRQSTGVGVIHSERGGMKDVLRALKDNRQVAMVSDQHAGSQGIIVEFLGRQVSVPRAPATLAVKTGAPIITGYILRRSDDTHFCHFDPPLYPDTAADPDREIYRLTKIYTGRFEEAIRRWPEMWLWTHRRFKYKPPEGSTVGQYVD